MFFSNYVKPFVYKNETGYPSLKDQHFFVEFRSIILSVSLYLLPNQVIFCFRNMSDLPKIDKRCPELILFVSTKGNKKNVKIIYKSQHLLSALRKAFQGKIYYDLDYSVFVQS